MLTPAAITHLIIAALIVAVSWLLGRVIRSVVRKLASYSREPLNIRILGVVGANIVLVSVVVGLYLAFKEARNAITQYDQTYVQVLNDLEIGLFLLLVLFGTIVASRVIKSAIEWYTEQASKKTASDVTGTVAPLTMRVINIILILIASIIILDHFGINIGSLLVSLGVVSLAVALAAQETIANMIAGFVILVDQPFRTGNRIKLLTGEEGDIVQIGLRSTRIVDYDYNLIVIPNSELVKNRIVNFSLPDHASRVFIEITAAHGTDLDRAREIMLVAAAGHPLILKDPAPAVYVMGISDSGVLLRLSARTADFRNRFPAETSLREELYRAFGPAGIAFGSPTRVIRQGGRDGS